MSFSFKLDSTGKVEMTVDSILTIEEQNEVNWVIAPEGFVMAQVFAKIKDLGKYVKAVQGTSEAVTSPTPPAPQRAYKPSTGEYGKCKKCGANNVLNPKTGKIFCEKKCWLQ